MGWAFLSGFAGSLSDSMKQKQEDKKKALIEEATLKRQMMLQKYSSDLMAERQAEDDKRQASEWDRRKEAEKNDIQSIYESDPYGGRSAITKSGEVKQLSQASPEVIEQAKKLEALKIRAQEANIAQSYASADASRASAERSRKGKDEDDSDEKETRKDIARIKQEYIKAFNKIKEEQAEEFDPKVADQTIRDDLKYIYGDVVDKALPKTETRAPYPDGTRLQGPDGKVYVVRNGKPVLE